MRVAPTSTEVPHKSPITDMGGVVTMAWEVFFRNVRKYLEPLGQERAFELTNNQAVAANIEGLSLDKRAVSQATVDYYIQRVTTGGGAVESIETGTLYLAYLPTSDAWVLSNGPTTSGVTVSITATGQIQYTTTNIAGTPSISKITFRARTLAAKNHQYSELGRS